MDCKYLYIDNIKINFVRRTIEIDNKIIDVTPREFDVVEFLLDNMNKIVPRQAIQEAVWGMLPKGPLGRRIIKKLKIYKTDKHDHAAQQPRVLQVSNPGAPVEKN